MSEFLTVCEMFSHQSKDNFYGEHEQSVNRDDFTLFDPWWHQWWLSASAPLCSSRDRLVPPGPAHRLYRCSRLCSTGCHPSTGTQTSPILHTQIQRFKSVRFKVCLHSTIANKRVIFTLAVGDNHIGGWLYLPWQ